MPVLAVAELLLIVPRAVIDPPGTWRSTSGLADRLPDDRRDLGVFRSGPSGAAPEGWALPVIAPARSPATPAAKGKKTSEAGPPKNGIALPGAVPNLKFPEVEKAGEKP